MSLGISQIFSLIAEAPEAMAAAQDFASTYNRHKPTIDRVMAILDPARDNPLPPEEAKKRAREVIEQTPELKDILARDQSGNN